MDGQYQSSYQTRAEWLLWLIRKSRPFFYLSLDPWGHRTSTFGAKMDLSYILVTYTISVHGLMAQAAMALWLQENDKIYIWGLGALTV